MPGLNDDEAPDLLAWAVEHDYELRFIEQMPLDAQHGWKRDGMITAGDILASLRTRFDAHRRGRRTSAARPPPSAGSSTAARTASASSPPSPARSAAPATAPGSRPTARSAPACSPREETDLRAALRSGRPGRGDRPHLAAGDVGQEGGLGPGRPVVPPAGPPDVGDRRLSRPRPSGSRRLPLLQRHDVLQEAAHPEELRQMLAVLLARQPGLAPLRSVQLRVVPGEHPHGGGAAALGGADRGLGSSSGSRRSSHRLRRPATRGADIGDAEQPRGELPGVGPSLRRGMRSAYEVCHG